MPTPSSIVSDGDGAKENIHEKAALVSQDPVRFGIWLRVAREMKCAGAKAMERVEEEGRHLFGMPDGEISVAHPDLKHLAEDAELPSMVLFVKPY